MGEKVGRKVCCPAKGASSIERCVLCALFATSHPPLRSSHDPSYSQLSWMLFNCLRPMPTVQTLILGSCLTVRHEKMFNRWRALDALNCLVGDEKIFDSATSYYYKVFCEACGTQVGARDEEAVYHFFGVFPSPPEKSM